MISSLTSDMNRNGTNGATGQLSDVSLNVANLKKVVRVGNYTHDMFVYSCTIKIARVYLKVPLGVKLANGGYDKSLKCTNTKLSCYVLPGALSDCWPKKQRCSKTAVCRSREPRRIRTSSFPDLEET